MRALLSFLLLALLATPAWADQTLPDLLGYRDDFSGPKILDGVLEPGTKAPWSIALEGGLLSFRNDSNNSALHYVTLPSIRFGGQRDRTGTDGAEPAARVRASATHNGGIGLLVGYADGGGDYVVFGVSSEGRYAILTKADGQLKITEFEKNEAVSPQGFNDLLLERQHGTMRFLVNGTQVYQQPAGDLEEAPVGVAVFGRGFFEFDEVRVRAPSNLVAELSAGAAQCPMQPATYDDTVVLVGVSGGPADSTISIVGQDDVTQVVDLAVAPGQSPLYLVASSHRPVIWRVSGATDRIRRFAAVGQAGVVGLPPDRLEFLSNDACPADFYRRGPAMSRAEAVASAALGETVDLAGALEEPGTVVISDASVEEGRLPTPVGVAADWDAKLRTQIRRFSPGGVIDLSPESVVSNRKVERYEVLPAEFGLAQMVADGILVRQSGTTFRVVEPMPRYPAGLSGAHAVSFIFNPGLPEPAGSPGDSRVIHQVPPRRRPAP